MLKPPQINAFDRASAARIARLADGSRRRMPDEKVTITAAVRPERVDIAELLDATRDRASLGGGLSRAVAGAAHKAAVGHGAERTVALSDGSLITFAPAKAPQEFEPV
jgi:hypothetical protein